MLVEAAGEALTGSPFILPWFMLEPVERYGFGQVWDFSAYRHTPWTALQNLGVLAVRFNAWWLGWPSGLLLLWLWWRNGRPLDGALVWILAGAAILLFQSLYYSTGVSDTGVTYHYELLLPAAVLGANAIRQGWRAAPRFTSALLVVHFAAGTAGFLWFHAGRLGRLADAIHQDADAALARVQRPALLLYDVHCSRCVRVGWVLSCFPR